jgi:tellurite resistance protein TehA-like permease
MILSPKWTEESTMKDEDPTRDGSTDDPRASIDARVDTPGREGLTGTAPANAYKPLQDEEQITIAPDWRPMEQQPAWRTDFPIDWPADHYVERREFMKFMVLTSLALTAGQFWILAQNWWRGRRGQPEIMKVAALDEVPVGGVLTFTYPESHDDCVLWATVTYTVFTALTVKAEKPPLAEGINGGWLVAVVAAQSVCVLGSQLAEGFGSYMPQVLLFCLAMWLGGGMLYIWIISLILYRYTFFVLDPADLAPRYWINMGAVAISTLAGTTLVSAAPQSPLLRELVPFLKGFTLLFWATATWWIPMLVILGVWRHVYRRFPLRYDPLYWGAVFPLGMYTVCTFRLAHVIDAPFLLVIPSVFLYVALAAWSLAMVGLVRQLIRHQT